MRGPVGRRSGLLMSGLLFLSVKYSVVAGPVAEFNTKMREKL